MLGCSDLPSKRDTSAAEKVKAIQPHFWMMVRTRDPYLWFLIKRWVSRLLLLRREAQTLLQDGKSGTDRP